MCGITTFERQDMVKHAEIGKLEVDELVIRRITRPDDGSQIASFYCYPFGELPPPWRASASHEAARLR